MHLKNLGFFIVGLLLFSGSAEAVSLRGSKNSLDRQHMMAKKMKFSIIRNTKDIEQMLVSQKLYSLPREGQTFYLDEDIGKLDPLHTPLYRTIRPLALKFLSEISRDFYNHFGQKRLKVTSLVRTIKYQRLLMQHNANAVEPSRSDHLTGAAMDISYKDLTHEEMQWMRRRLAELKSWGWVNRQEEHHQACFHIMVFRS